MTPMQVFRLFKIFNVIGQHTFNRSLVKRRGLLKTISYANPWSYSQQKQQRGQNIRKAIESLGPIFIKFGQMLSLRSDMLPEDVIQELEKLQDQVPPFCSQQAMNIIERALQSPISQVFSQFEPEPLAAASIAQVHSAELPNGESVIVKVLRPGIEKTIRADISLMYAAARLFERFHRFGDLLRPVSLVEEFEYTILNELNLQREAANASQLRRNFEHSTQLYVPKIYWDYTRQNVLVMERIHGVPIAQIDRLKQANTNLEKLSRYGVEIFFTQVFNHSFFHADMHPGNFFVDINDPENPKYIGVDFGIMGSLSDEDQRYLALNLMAFFNRDYRRVAQLHIDSGWVNANTRVEQFEFAIRTVSEPIFEKPLGEISFSNLLLQLFRTAERFEMKVQPQLMLLQKTLLGMESLGRNLNPNLDLWETAKPFIENWLKRRHSPRQLLKRMKTEWAPVVNDALRSPQQFKSYCQDLVNVKQPLPRTAKPTKPNPTRWLLPLSVFIIGISLFLPPHTARWLIIAWGLLVTIGMLI